MTFAIVLLAAVLLSAQANRTIMSTAVIFLVAGFVAGQGVFGWIDLAPGDEVVSLGAELALFAVLFTDGMKVGWKDLRSAWRLPGRALAFGLPLTLLLTAVLAHFVAGLAWPEALLIGAILAPTDPVFASALVGNKRVPGRLRHLLNVESGVNDGLALPFVLILLATAEGSGDLHLGELGTEILVGLLIGVIVPWLAIKLEGLSIFSASAIYAPLNGFAIGLLVFAFSEAFHGNLFLAAFAAGITVATVGEGQRESFELFGELLAELLKLFALLVFGALISVEFLSEIPWTGWLFAVLALLLARPLALAPCFIGTELSAREQGAAMWFGPKGFASVVYGLIVLNSPLVAADEIYHLVALTIVISILAHSSTDVVVARWFDEPGETPHWHGEEPDSGPPAPTHGSPTHGSTGHGNAPG